MKETGVHLKQKYIFYVSMGLGIKCNDFNDT